MLPELFLQTPKGQTPKGQAPKGQTPKGQAPKGQAPKGQAPKGQAPKGQALWIPQPVQKMTYLAPSVGGTRHQELRGATPGLG